MKAPFRAALAAILLFFAAEAAASGRDIINVGKEKNTCRFCHGAVGNKFFRGVHAEFDVKCTDCHGGDGTATEKQAAMSPLKGFTGKIAPARVPAICGRCHADYLRMRQYGIGASQLEEYRTSVHGIRLLKDGDGNVAQCASCHDAHDVRRVTDPSSQVYPVNVPRMCAACHGDSALMRKYGLDPKIPIEYVKSIHGTQLVEKRNLDAPSCASCHGSHGAAPPGVDEIVNVCGKCHINERDQFVRSSHFHKNVRCVDCHRGHGMGEATESLYGKVRGGCRSCHADEKSGGGQVAEKLREMRTVSVLKIRDAEKDIRNASADGMDVRRQRRMLASARAGMKKYGAVQHQASVDAAEEILDREVNSRAEVIQSDVEAYYDAALNRKIIAGIVAVCVVMFALLLYARRRMRSGNSAAS